MSMLSNLELIRRVPLFALLTAVWPVVAVLLVAPVERDVSIPLTLPTTAGAWRVGGIEAGQEFRPLFSGHRGVAQEGYTDGRRTVGAYVAVYANQTQGHELVRAGNVLLSDGTNKVNYTDILAVRDPSRASLIAAAIKAARGRLPYLVRASSSPATVPGMATAR